MGTVVDILVCEPGFKGKYLFIQPVGQGQIFRIPAQKRHGRMAVGIVKTGHQQFAGAVIPLAEVLLRLRVADAGDFAVPHPHKAVCLIVERVVQNSDVGKKHFGFHPFLLLRPEQDSFIVYPIIRGEFRSRGVARGTDGPGPPGEKSAAKASFVLFGRMAIWYDEAIRSRRG